jgi:ADP-ribose pyrophosphatase YjhB (NUDIX family)
MDLPVPVRRLGYRAAYLGLRVYWLVAHPTTSGVKCLLTDGEQILLVRHTYGRREWELPGGSMKIGESPLIAARREMREELGVSVDQWTRLEEAVIDDHHRHDRVNYMAAEVRAPRFVIDRGELAKVQWFSRRELPEDLGRYARAVIATLPALDN